jgi:hypothetical protein
MIPLLASSRLPRFRRVREDAGALALTARDRAILEHVHRHRFLSSAQIILILSGRLQPVLRRLQLLYHHGYLDRPRAQIDYYHRGGSRPMVYGLGRRGAELLGLIRSRFEERQVGRLHLQHTLRVADVLVGVELACKRREGVEFIPAASLAEDLAPGRPFQWPVTVRHDGAPRRVGVIPDGVFALRGPDGRRVLHFVEADRGTMPVRRRSLAASSVFRKLLAYAATWEHGLHASRFGVARFRVLVVTSSHARARRMVEECGALERGRGLFLFMDHTAFMAGDPLAVEWTSGHGGPARLWP